MADAAQRPFRFGILGTGRIAQWWQASVRASSTVQVLAVGSREAASARAFAERAGLPRWHPSYQALIDDAQVDVVYIALPNHLHLPWAQAALRAGKHVLCEKPLACSFTDALAMFTLARSERVVLQEAFAYRFTAQARSVTELVNSGAIGIPLIVRTNTSYVRDDAASHAGAGALMDSGCYAVGIAQLVMKRSPLRVQAIASFGAGGRDDTLVGTLDFGDGAYGQISCSTVATSAPHTQVVGSDGALETGFENASWEGRPLTVRVKRSRAQDAEFEDLVVPGTDGYRAEAEAMACLVRGEPAGWPGMSEAESLDVAATLDALRVSAPSGAWVPVGRSAP